MSWGLEIGVESVASITRMTDMQNTTIRVLLLSAMVGASCAQASTVIPAQGQTPEQIQADTAACQSQGAQASAAAAPAPAPAPQGGRLRGAAVGAAAGAAAAEVRGNQYEAYDRVDSDVQQEYRQNQAQEAAVAGAVVGGAKQRQQRRQSTQQQQAAAQTQQQQGSQAFDACMGARGYTVQP
jgi:hypothetical protein